MENIVSIDRIALEEIVQESYENLENVINDILVQYCVSSDEWDDVKKIIMNRILETIEDVYNEE